MKSKKGRKIRFRASKIALHRTRFAAIRIYTNALQKSATGIRSPIRNIDYKNKYHRRAQVRPGSNLIPKSRNQRRAEKKKRFCGASDFDLNRFKAPWSHLHKRATKISCSVNLLCIYGNTCNFYRSCIQSLINYPLIHPIYTRHIFINRFNM